jgi:hypothetical protein
MEQKIFTNLYNLKYSKQEIEVEFNLVKDKLLKKYIKTITILTFLISFGPSIVISNLFSFSELKSFKMIMCFSYFMNFSCLIMTFTTFLSKNIKFMKIIIYLNYYFILFFILNIRYPLVHFVKSDIMYIFFLVCADVFIRTLWIIYEIFTFLELFTLNLLSAISMWAIYTPVGEAKMLQIDFLISGVNSICLIIVILFGFISERNQKKAFYFKYKTERKAQWLDNVLDNMKTGFLSIKGEKITYVNNYLEKLFDAWICKTNKIDHIYSGKN